MNTEGFRLHGKNVVDYICDYNSTLTSRQVAPNLSLEPGFLKNLIPGKKKLFILSPKMHVIEVVHFEYVLEELLTDTWSELVRMFRVP